jgi:nitrite reductase/ring-hydroxylating ferredoxin subunit
MRKAATLAGIGWRRAAQPDAPMMQQPTDDPAWRERDFAPAPGTRVCGVEDVPDGMAKEFLFGEGRQAFRLLVLRSGARVFGYVNCCPHFSIPLNVEPDRFTLFEHEHIYCSTHCAMFRFQDGYCEDGPCAGASLERVALEVNTDGVRIALR